MNTQKERKYFPSLKKPGVLAGLAAIVIMAAFFIWNYWPFRKMEINEVAAKVLPAAVLIRTETSEGAYSGSGFFVRGGKIFTNAHVVKDAKSITVKTHTGKTFPAEVLDENKELDLRYCLRRKKI